ncbi:hypothetical protein HN371_08485 [Candidatus Poribacteria bacterium]|nr:hypothetical protein [Candidatus Poribacteria bacterium]MBT5533575.1 hypothetical protein [Candidatus Poribacteria bacterium]MBT5709643.1 hypothetical protein [Candidatus Poribacteria bacterium]MBT7095972.1 hypothetical protein [Candidatus Poribacteria bacterium]MBT7809041.1 hypothetical protein [Candidatus Poribacteria bacterium]
MGSCAAIGDGQWGGVHRTRRAPLVCHGCPTSGPGDAACTPEHTEGGVGFHGASSIKRLPTKRAITGQVESFKSLTL